MGKQLTAIPPHGNCATHRKTAEDIIIPDTAKKNLNGGLVRRTHIKSIQTNRQLRKKQFGS
jgi:hypothetical protein